MVGFDFFTQPSVPNVDVTLFGKAAETGVELGKAIPTTTTAILTGIKSGIQEGMKSTQDQQQINMNAQQMQMNADKLKQMPDQQKILDAQASAAQPIADAQIATAQNITAAQGQQQQFWSAFKSADPLTQKQMVLGGQYDQMFAQSPQTYRQAFATVSPYLDDNELRAGQIAGAKINLGSTYDAATRRALANESVYRQALENDQAISDAAAVSGLDRYNIPLVATPVPAGTYAYDPLTRVIKTDNVTGQRVAGASPSPRNKDYIYGDKVIAANVEPDSYKNFTNWRDNQAFTSGRARRDALDQLGSRLGPPGPGYQTQEGALQVQGAPQPQVQGGAPQAPMADGTVSRDVSSWPRTFESGVTPTPTPTKVVSPNAGVVQQISKMPVQSNTGEITVSKNNPYAKAIMQWSLGLPDPKFKEINPEVHDFLSQTEEAPQGWWGNYSASQQQAQIRTKEKIASYSAGAEFDTDPILQKKYTLEAVTKHNKDVEFFESQVKNSSLISPEGGTNFVPFFANKHLDQMQKVNTPRELYILERQGFYTDLLDHLFTAYKDQMDASKRAALASPQRGAEALKAMGQ